MTASRADSTPSLTILGDVCVDHVLGPVDGWPRIGTEVMARASELRAGGSGANTALAMRHLGQPCRLLSLVGNDAFGQWLPTQLCGISAELRELPFPTSVSVCVLHVEGERTIFTTEGHLEQARESDLTALLEPAVPGSILLLSGSFVMPRVSDDYDRIITLAQSLGYAIAIDTGWPTEGWSPDRRETVLGWLARADHMLLSDLEVRSLADRDRLDDAIAWLSGKMGPTATLVVKRGVDGAAAVQGGVRRDTGAPVVEVFDTVGAGDAFNAGYLAARLRQRPLDAALAAGCRAASAIIAHFPRATIRPGEFADLCMEGDVDDA